MSRQVAPTILVLFEFVEAPKNVIAGLAEGPERS